MRIDKGKDIEKYRRILRDRDETERQIDKKEPYRKGERKRE